MLLPSLVRMRLPRPSSSQVFSFLCFRWDQISAIMPVQLKSSTIGRTMRGFWTYIASNFNLLSRKECYFSVTFRPFPLHFQQCVHLLRIISNRCWSPVSKSLLPTTRSITLARPWNLSDETEPVRPLKMTSRMQTRGQMICMMRRPTTQ